MATELILPATRFVAQVNSGSPAPKTNYKALAERNAKALEECRWENTVGAGKASLVPHDFTVSFTDARYDAFCMTGNYNSSANTEVAYAGMAAYRFKLPQDYMTGDAMLASMSLMLSRDRFLLPGLRVSAVLSDSESPSSNWDVVRGDAEGCVKLAAQLPNEANRITAAEPATGAVEIDLADLDNPQKRAYLWIYLTVEDYTATWTWYSSTQHRLYAIEGSGMVIAETSTIVFSADVTPDGEGVIGGFVVANGALLPVGSVMSRTLVIRTDASPIVSESDGTQAPVRQADGIDAAFALSRLYADFFAGGDTPENSGNGATFSVNRTSGDFPTLDSDRPANTDILRLESSVLTIPFTLPAGRVASSLALEFPAVSCATGSHFNVFLAADNYLASLPEDVVKNPGLYDCRTALFRLLGEIRSGTSATFPISDFLTSQSRVATLIISGWLSPEFYNLVSGGLQGTGSLVPTKITVF